MDEVDQWVEGLGASDREAAALIEELIENAQDDGMTPADFLIVRKARTIIEARLGTPAERLQPTRRSLIEDFFDQEH
jgi:hypothetical protein